MKNPFRILLPFTAAWGAAGLSSASGLDGRDNGAASIRPSFSLAQDAFPIRGEIVEDKDISGIAIAENGRGILVSDEGGLVQSLAFSSDGSEVTVQHKLLLGPSADEEIDFEAVAFSGGWFYAVGSHGAAKKSGEYEASRSRIFRFQLEGDGAEPREPQVASLDAVLAAEPLLKPHHRKPLQRRGTNIEGLAVVDGRLYVGLRSPNLEGDAVVLQLDADALFSGQVPPHTVHRVRLGPGMGIRDMAAVRGGFLIVAGNAGSESSKEYPAAQDYLEGRPSHLVFWNPEGPSVTVLGEFPRAGKGKEEALCILRDEPGSPLEMLVLVDGVKGGKPRKFEAGLSR